ncbi:MAG TPA: type IV pilin protein [Cellvibrionaceae bacterium]
MTKLYSNTYRKQAGFSLIELMIVVAVIGILAAIAYPSYMDSVRKSNRADAKAALNDAAQQMQRCYTLNSTFVDCDDNVAATSPEEFYTIAVAATATTFTVTAEADGTPQSNDTGCTIMTLNHLGQTTPDESFRCW